MTSLVDRYAYLDALDDFIFDSDKCVELMCEFLSDDVEAADLESFLESKHPDVLREFEEQYEKDRKEIENVA